jgi:hypothetical protein
LVATGSLSGKSLLNEGSKKVAVAMNRQFRRRVQREWNKIKLDKPCTRFVERNGLFTLPHSIYFQAVKISDDLMCVHWVSMFEYKEDFGHLESVVVCQLVGCLFRSQCSVELGFVPEEDLEEYAEME